MALKVEHVCTKEPSSVLSMRLHLPLHMVSAGFHMGPLDSPAADMLVLVGIRTVPGESGYSASTLAGQDGLLFPKSLAANSHPQARPEVAAAWLRLLRPRSWSTSIAAPPISSNAR